MFELLFVNLRAQGVKVGLGEWLAFLEGLKRGLVVDLDSLYGFGRAMLCTSEGQFDAWDIAFQATFAGVELPPEIAKTMADWLAQSEEMLGPKIPTDMTPEELLEAFRKRLAEQKERHDGGNRWIGTNGRSPFGNSGQSQGGIRVGGKGGGRSAMQVAGDRVWANYRVDTALQIRDFQLALRLLRNLVREGRMELSLDGTIDRTAKNAGEIELDWQRERTNRIHLVLIMDTGGSMDPHSRMVERLLSAASEMKGFKSFSSWQFHNAPYGWLYKDYATYERKSIPEVLKDFTPQHRIIWVGDASMAPWELFSAFRGGSAYDHDPAHTGMNGLDWVQLIARRCPATVWLNPDPPRYWDHPTVSAIGAVVPMFPLTLGGLRDAIKRLKQPRVV